MALYQSAILLKAQTMLNKKYNEAEMRRKLRPMINHALAHQDYTLPDASEQRKKEDRPIETHFLLQKAPGASVVKATRHTGGMGDSAKVDLTWMRLTETFSFSQKMAQDKLFNSEQLFAHNLEQAILNLQDRAETVALAQITAARCKLAAAAINTNGTGTWNETTDALDISVSEADYLIQNIKTFMFGRHYRGELDFFCDLLLYPKLERIRNQGAGNDTNTGFQFNGVNIVPTTEQIVGGYARGCGLVMPKNAVACMYWNDPLNRRGYGRDNDYIGTFTTLKDPFGLNLKYDVSVYSDRADTVASHGGHIQDVVDQYEISMSIAFAYPPLATANDSVIHLVGQLNA